MHGNILRNSQSNREGVHINKNNNKCNIEYMQCMNLVI